jgi:uncharacterized protein YbjT (DUF2867 family)
MMRILVTGATGNVGRLVVDHLLAAGATQVRALTANPAKAALPAGVEVIEGYLGRIDTMPTALEGVDRMYLAPLPRTVREVVSLARQAGVQQIVDLAGPEGGQWHAVEQAVEASGIAWTHLEAGQFMPNSQIWAEQIRTTGTVCDAYPGAADAPIALADIAAVAAAVLLQDGHVGKAYELTGPETITRAERVRLIGEALGRDIPFVELTHEQAVEQLRPVMGEHAAWYLDRMAHLVEHPQRALPTVEEITGRQGTTFAKWAIQHADTFR